MNNLSAGSSEIIITPPIGADMEGYSKRIAQGVNDDIRATAVVLDNSSHKTAICSVDLCELKKPLIESVRNRIAHKIGISPGAVIVAATHTHSGPSLDSDNIINQKWLLEFEDKLVKVVLDANDNLRDAEIGSAIGEAEGIGGNRNDLQNGPIDHSVNLIKIVDAENKKIIAVVINYSCHATTLDLHNKLITADYPGFAREYIVKFFKGIKVLFLNGACGDINPGGYSAEDSAMGIPIPNRTFERAIEIGEILGKEALRLIKKTLTHRQVNIQTETRTVHMPLKKMKLPAEADLKFIKAQKKLKALDLAEVSDKKEYYRCKIEAIYAEYEKKQAKTFFYAYSNRIVPNEIQGVAIGDSLLVGFPGEVFTEIGTSLKEYSSFKKTLAVSYANDYAGYFPSRKALKDNIGYEVKMCDYDETAIKHLEAEAKLLADDLYKAIKR